MNKIEQKQEFVDYYVTSLKFIDLFSEKVNFSERSEMSNILSDINQNIFLLKMLNDCNLLKPENRIVDCGLGLGVALYDLYLQSKEIKNKKFVFTGIEKYEHYNTFFICNLLEKWNDELELIEGDIMNQDYYNYNIIYTYNPFLKMDKAAKFYDKLVDEISPKSIIIENKNKGLGRDNLLQRTKGLTKIQLDDIFVFVKN